MKTSRTLMTVVLAALALQVRAQSTDTPPAPTAPRPFAIAAPSENTLPNGLRVIVAQRHGVPLVSAELLILSGSETDPDDRAGLATMTAGLLTKGTTKRSAPAIAAAAEALGGKIDSGATWDRSSVSMTVTVPKLEPALALIGEVVTQPAFRQEELDRLRAEIGDGLKVSYARPAALASLVATRNTYGQGAYGHPASGTPLSLQRVTRADVRADYRTWYRPDRAVLILAGDIEPERAMALATKAFGAWRAPKTAVPPPAPIAADAGKTAMTVLDMGQSGQAAVVLAAPLPTADATTGAIGDVTNTVLGGGYSSRLNQEIRIKRGLSYGARSDIDKRRGGSVFLVSVQTKNESAVEVYGLVKAEVDRIADAPVPADELAARKATLIGSFSRAVETTEGLAEVIATLVGRDEPVADLPGRIDRLSNVSAAQVQDFAKSRFAPAARRIVVAGDASVFEAGLRAVAPDATSIRQDALGLER